MLLPVHVFQSLLSPPLWWSKAMLSVIFVFCFFLSGSPRSVLTAMMAFKMRKEGARLVFMLQRNIDVWVTLAWIATTCQCQWLCNNVHLLFTAADQNKTKMFFSALMHHLLIWKRSHKRPTWMGCEWLSTPFSRSQAWQNLLYLTHCTQAYILGMIVHVCMCTRAFVLVFDTLIPQWKKT